MSDHRARVGGDITEGWSRYGGTDKPRPVGGRPMSTRTLIDEVGTCYIEGQVVPRWLYDRYAHPEQTGSRIAQLEAVVEAARELRPLMLAPHKFIEQRVQAIAVFDNALAALEQTEETG